MDGRPRTECPFHFWCFEPASSTVASLYWFSSWRTFGPFCDCRPRIPYQRSLCRWPSRSQNLPRLPIHLVNLAYQSNTDSYPSSCCLFLFKCPLCCYICRNWGAQVRQSHHRDLRHLPIRRHHLKARAGWCSLTVVYSARIHCQAFLWSSLPYPSH